MMTFFELLDSLEELGLKNCRIGSFVSVPKEFILDGYVKKSLSKSISNEIEPKLIINEGESSDRTRYQYSTEVFVFTKDELKKFVKWINQNR